MTPPVAPPPIAARLLARLVPHAWSEQFLGDLDEEFAYRTLASPFRARWWYRRQIVRVVWSRATRRPVSARSPAGNSVQRVLQDFSTAWRALRRQPRFAALVVLMLGASLGTSAAVLALVNTYLWKPLPYPASDRLVLLGAAPRPPGPPGSSVPSPRDRSALDYRALGDVADLVLTTDPDGLTILNEGNPQTVLGAWTTADIFPMFDIHPVAGRLFTPEEVNAGRPVAMISQRLWRGRYAGDPAAVGKTLTVRGFDRPDEVSSFTIVGVLPPRFWPFDDRTEILVPLKGPAEPFVIRLREGVTAEAADELLTARVAAANGGADPRWRVGLAPIRARTVEPIRQQLQAVAIAVGLLLLIAFANLAMLHTARALAEERTVALKIALGAARARVLRETIAESLIIGVAAWLTGWGIASLGTAGLLPLIEDHLGALVPGAGASALLTPAVIGFMAGVAIAMSVLLAVLPKLRRADAPARALTGRANDTGTPRRARARHALVVMQVASTMALLVGAGLMMRTAAHLEHVDVGFNPAGVFTARLTIPDRVYTSPDEQRRVIGRLTSAVASLPDVEAASLVAGFAVGSRQVRPVLGDGASSAEPARAATVAVTPDYFSIVRLPILEGRALSPDDTAAREFVAVISVSLAKALWPEGPAVGRVIRSAQLGRFRNGVQTGEDSQPYRVVGVSADVRRSLRRSAVPEIYVPLDQVPQSLLTLHVSARAGGDASTLLAPISRAVHAIDPELPVSNPVMLDAAIASGGDRPRFLATVLGVFAVLAATSALIGVFAVSAWIAGQRRREAAVRLALGARPRDVIRTLTMTGGTTVVVGLAAGWLISIGLGRLLADELSGVAASDPPTRALVAAVLFAVCVAAIVWPARRVAHANPVSVLRD